MSQLKASILEHANALYEKVKEIREHIHAHPELSFQEKQTAQYIIQQLEQEGIPYQAGLVGTGIVALIEGREPATKIIALRADMDALPIQEENKVPYCSKNTGVMHACGHDVHSACLLGAAMILNRLRKNIRGTVKLIFQPGEEVLPGGASLMIKEGVLENPSVHFMFGQHVFPSMEYGKVGFRSGMYMASTDEIYLTIKGKGGHAAMPADYINPLLIGAEIVSALHQLFMQKEEKDENGLTVPTVLAFGKMTANGATNVIPDTLKLEGTFRTMNEDWRERAHERIKKTVQEIVVKWKAEAEVNIVKGYPFLVNDEQLTARAKQAAVELLGTENVEELPMRMTAEDFAFYSQKVPSCFYRLGTGNKAKGITAGVHTATFDIEPQSLKTGTALMAWLALKELEG